MVIHLFKAMETPQVYVQFVPLTLLLDNFKKIYTNTTTGIRRVKQISLNKNYIITEYTIYTNQFIKCKLKTLKVSRKILNTLSRKIKRNSRNYLTFIFKIIWEGISYINI